MSSKWKENLLNSLRYLLHLLNSYSRITSLKEILQIVVLDNHKTLRKLNVISKFFKLYNKVPAEEWKISKSAVRFIPKYLKAWCDMDSLLSWHRFQWMNKKRRKQKSRPFYLRLFLYLRDRFSFWSTIQNDI